MSSWCGGSLRAGCRTGVELGDRTLLQLPGATPRCSFHLACDLLQPLPQLCLFPLTCLFPEGCTFSTISAVVDSLCFRLSEDLGPTRPPFPHFCSAPLWRPCTWMCMVHPSMRAALLSPALHCSLGEADPGYTPEFLLLRYSEGLIIHVTHGLQGPRPSHVPGYSRWR